MHSAESIVELHGRPVQEKRPVRLGSERGFLYQPLVGGNSLYLFDSTSIARVLSWDLTIEENTKVCSWVESSRSHEDRVYRLAMMTTRDIE